jgi:hypothetical protein
MVHHLQIHPDYSITHTNYHVLVPPERISDRLHQLPQPIQHNYLKRQLQTYLYDLYFTGEQVSTAAKALKQSSENLQNNTVRGVDAVFFQQLQQNNRGKGYFDPGWLVLYQDAEELAVEKEGLTLYIDPNIHLQVGQRSPQPGDEVALRLPHNQIESRFYAAIGDAGAVPDEVPALAIYFNVNAEGVIALMQHFTQHLNALALPFSFKVLFDPDECDRRDTGILQIARSAYETIYPILQQVYTAEQMHFREAVPLFTKRLAPGIGLAEEPDLEPDDFGWHRCQLLSEAMIAVCHPKEDNSELRLHQIQQAFVQHGLDLKQPYLNPGSKDCYSSLISASKLRDN